MENNAPNSEVVPREQQGPTQKGPEQSGIEGNSLEVLKSLAEVSAVFVGLTYIGGWSYVSSYYTAFGLNALELDLPLPLVCTTSLYVLFSAVWPLIAIAAIVGIGFWLHYFLRHLRRILTVIILALLLITAAVAGLSDGRRRARRDMLIDSNALPYVSFSVKIAKTDQPPCVEHETYGSFDCKLLLHSKGTYYFFTPIPRNTGSLTSVGSLNVYTLADSDISGIHLLRGLDRNAGAK